VAQDRPPFVIERLTGSEAPPAQGITINQIVGDRNQAGGSSAEASKTQKLAERLTTLRDLYNRKLISQEVYDRESQHALHDLGD